MNKDEIERVMLASVGDPSGGVLKDFIPVMAIAVAAALNPAESKEKRIVKPAETR